MIQYLLMIFFCKRSFNMAAHDIYCKIAQAKTWLLLVVKNIAWITKYISLLLFISTLVLFTHWLLLNFLLIVLLLSRENDSTVAILKTVFIYSINKERRTKANIQIRMFKLDYLSNSNHDRIVVRCDVGGGVIRNNQ